MGCREALPSSTTHKGTVFTHWEVTCVIYRPNVSLSSTTLDLNPRDKDTEEPISYALYDSMLQSSAGYLARRKDLPGKVILVACFAREGLFRLNKGAVRIGRWPVLSQSVSP